MAKKPKKIKKLISRQRCIKLLDAIVSRIVRISASNENGLLTCYTCPSVIHWKEAHCCHFIERACLKHRFNFENLRAGCPSCNVYRKENHKRVFTIKLIEEYGLAKVKSMQDDKYKIYQIGTPELRELLDEMKAKLKQLEEGRNIGA